MQYALFRGLSAYSCIQLFKLRTQCAQVAIPETRVQDNTVATKTEKSYNATLLFMKLFKIVRAEWNEQDVR